MRGITRARLFTILEGGPAADWVDKAFDSAMVTLIVLNTAAVMLETVDSLSARYAGAFHTFEVFSVAVFSVEYVLRLYACVSDKRYGHPLTGRLRFAATPLALVDLLAILPALLAMTACDLRFIRILRIFRIARLFKAGRYSKTLQLLGGVLTAKRQELLATLLGALPLLVCASGAMYYAEHEAQPKQFASIPAAMWWTIVTLTTVGYGDCFPVTVLGKAVAGVTALLGIGMFALPAGIVASGFAEVLAQRRAGPRTCPHCGKEIEEHE